MSENRIWYIVANGQTVGPFASTEIAAQIKSGQLTENSYLFAQGMSDWTFLKDIPEFKQYLTVPVHPPAAPVAETVVPAYVQSVPEETAPEQDAAAPVATYAPAEQKCHEIDFVLHGDDMQFVDIILDPGEIVVAEAGAMMYMSSGIGMETRFSDGSAPDKGFMGKLLDAGKRVVTGESLFMTMFSNQGSGRETVAFGAPYPGKIIPVDLSEHGGSLICQKDAFLCAAYGTAIGIAFNKRIGAGFFGGEGFILQRLDGDGKAFIHACGAIIRKDLAAGDHLRVDTGCLVALEQTVSYDIKFVGNVKSAVFGGEGLFFATLTGPGTVYLQSLPFSRLADRIYKHAPSAGGSRKGEGSILGGLGNLLDGD